MTQAKFWKLAALVAVPLMAVAVNAQSQAEKGNQQTGQSGQSQSASGGQKAGSNSQQSSNSQSSSNQKSSDQVNQNKSDTHKDSSGARQQNSSDRNQQASGQTSRSGQQDRNRDSRDNQTNRRNDQQERRDGDQQRRNQNSSNQHSSNRKYKNASDLGFKFNGGNDRLIIADVSNDGPIARFGFRKGDRIVSVNGHRVTREDELLRYLLVRDVDRVTVIVVRDGREETIYVEPAVFIEEDDYSAVDPLQRFGIVIDERDDRIIVVEVIDDSPAYRAGLRQGDVLVTLGGHEYRTRSDVEKAVRELKSGDAKVQVRRGEKTRDFSVKVSDSNSSRGESQRSQGNSGDQRRSERNDTDSRRDSSSGSSSRDKQSEQREREDKHKENGSRDQSKDDQSSGNANSDANKKSGR